MSHSIKRSVFLLTAALMLGSCSSPNLEIEEHGLHGAENAEIVYVPHTAADTDVPDTLPPETTAIEAVVLPETTTAAAAVPVSAVSAYVAAEEAPATSAQDQYIRPVTSTNSYMLAVSANVKTYEYETQNTNGTLNILGPNLIYVGESFRFGFSSSSDTSDSDILWTSLGAGGRIDKNGVFTATGKSICTVIATDRKTNVYAAMRVHCIENADDVDFIPLVNGIPIANKTYPLPKDYDPGLDSSARAAFLKLQAAAKAEGLNIYPISAYRSYNYQKQVYAGWVAMYGSEADLISARPGHSEHQLGLAIDVNSAEYSFAKTKEGIWLAAHCAEYGFILRYPSFDAQRSTGYSYEPWHIRYVGKPLARTVTDSGKTLEELLGIDSYYR